MELKKGYKQTEVGVIPEDWEVKKLNTICDVRDGTHESPKYLDDGVTFITSKNIINGKIDFSDVTLISKNDAININKRSKVNKGDILMSMIGTIGNSVLIDFEPDFCIKNVALFKPQKVLGRFFIQLLYSLFYQTYINGKLDGGIQKFISLGVMREFDVPLPPTKTEQTAIAAALSDADALIQSLEKLIAKKRLIKQGAMQELLKPKEGRVVKTLEESTNCLDNLRIPLNESQRASMKGDIPYCGANGILDYINDYCIDDDIILIAEDGGYFDEYAHRPIAYKMSGKCWVNNHAHILQAKEDMSQDFVFYSLVHKNILRFLASGTRAKLNKSEMFKIEIDAPLTKFEQTRIATILSDMDAEIFALETKLSKHKQIKQGMMQELLTGKIRLV
jgi:type I restriction enzyme S subunit